MQLNIIYEDKDILVCFKPVGIATQTASLHSQDMVSMLKNYLSKQEGKKSPYIGVIHRLDQPVSGLLVFAKNQKASASLSKQIQGKEANKDYIALCAGVLKEREGTLQHYIMKDPIEKTAKVISVEHYVENKDSSYKEAILNYKVEKEMEDCSIVKVHLQTGRFHQIRAQFSAIGHALLGDGKYGTRESKEISAAKRVNRIALCANQLTFKHPVTGQKMNFILEKDYLPNWYGNLK